MVRLQTQSYSSKQSFYIYKDCMDWDITNEEYIQLIMEFLDKDPKAIKLKLKIWILKGNHRQVLTSALNIWEHLHGKENVDIKYIESDSFIKRIVKNKVTGITKTIYQEIYYESKWYWYTMNKTLTTVVRPGL